MQELIDNVKAIEMDGLVWGAHKLVEVGYGIKKLQINLVVEDDKVGVSDLQEKIEEDEGKIVEKLLLDCTLISSTRPRSVHRCYCHAEAVSLTFTLHMRYERLKMTHHELDAYRRMTCARGKQKIIL
jgi:translation elongation factor EF-1beta